MSRLFYEIGSKILRQSVIITIALIFCVCVIQSSKFMHFISSSQATLGQVAEVLLLLSVDMIAIVLPVAMAISICIVLFKFKRSNQLLAMQSFGVPIKSLLKPVFCVSLLSTLCLYSITLYFSPIALQSLKIMRVGMINNISFPKHSGNLLNIGGISVFADRYIGSFKFKKLIVIDNRSPGVFRAYSADSGQLIDGVITMNNGEIVEFQKKTNRISSIKFQEHAYNLRNAIQRMDESYSSHEMSSLRLLANLHDKKCNAEFHNRIISPMLVVLLGLLALLCTCIKNNVMRVAKSSEIIFAILSITCVEAISLALSNVMTRNEFFITVYYAFIVMSILLSIFLINICLDK